MNILVPTDFSNSSLNALQYAFALAEKIESAITILYVGEKDGVADKLKKLTKESPIKLRTIFKSGRAAKTIINYANQSETDLIVMGTKGASGMKKLVLGSNTVNVLEKTSIPVLVVPEQAEYKSLRMNDNRNNIVLASDFGVTANEDALDLVKQIATLFDANEIRLLGVRPKNTKLNMLAKVERSREDQYFGKDLTVTRKTVYSDNILHGINYYLGLKDDVAFVAMISRKEKEFLQKRLTSEMAFHSQLPLLILRDTIA